VLGCLLEKQRTTPDAYPLSLNALRLACNQSTNRDPVADSRSSRSTRSSRLSSRGLRSWARSVVRSRRCTRRGSALALLGASSWVKASSFWPGLRAIRDTRPRSISASGSAGSRPGRRTRACGRPLLELSGVCAPADQNDMIACSASPWVAPPPADACTWAHGYRALAGASGSGPRRSRRAGRRGCRLVVSRRRGPGWWTGCTPAAER